MVIKCQKNQELFKDLDLDHQEVEIKILEWVDIQEWINKFHQHLELYKDLEHLDHQEVEIKIIEPVDIQEWINKFHQHLELYKDSEHLDHQEVEIKILEWVVIQV